MVATERVAVLIDCENISARAARAIMEETAKHGTLSIKRAYGDFTSPLISGWRSALPTLAIQPVQQFQNSKGKNAADSALIIDAMDLLYGTQTDVFCIISSDGDFTRLATRLRESGKRVYGIGARSTPEAFRNACDRFTYLELLTQDTVPPSPARPAPAEADPGEPRGVVTSGPSDGSATGDAGTIDQALPDLPVLLEGAIRASAKDDGWAPLSTVGWYIVNNHPTFDSRDYGYPKLGDLVRDQPAIAVTTRFDSGGTGHIWVSVNG